MALVDVNKIDECCIVCGCQLVVEFQLPQSVRSVGMNGVKDGKAGYVTLNCPNRDCDLCRMSIAYDEYAKLDVDTLQRLQVGVAIHRSNK